MATRFFSSKDYLVKLQSQAVIYIEGMCLEREEGIMHVIIHIATNVLATGYKFGQTWLLALLDLCYTVCDHCIVLLSWE